MSSNALATMQTIFNFIVLAWDKPKVCEPTEEQKELSKKLTTRKKITITGFTCLWSYKSHKYK